MISTRSCFRQGIGAYRRDPDGDSVLDRFGGHLNIGEAPMLALVAEGLLIKALLQDFQSLIHARSALLERNAECCMFSGPPSGTDPEVEAPIRDDVDRCSILG